jgi:UDP-N-acetylglucosamine 2-epimerase (non-hydrolysing)/UDP-N-acetylglucosamine 2-epimerase (hydrolysing)
MSTYLVCTGTRPEIIKMAPVYRLLKERGETVQVLHTGQHEEMAHSLYRFFDMGPDHEMHLLREQPGLSQLTAELLQGIDQILAQTKPDVVLVQGDTSSALVGAMAAYFRDIPVAHIEAGLRTGLHDPFPEEKHRELIGRLAHWHFPPTPQASDNLLREGVPKQDIYEVGNTVIDTALWVQQQGTELSRTSTYPESVRQMMDKHPGAPLMLVTAHRRENWGRPIQHIAAAVGTLLRINPELIVVWPQHPNPDVRQDIALGLGQLASDCAQRLCLTEPLAYPALIGLLSDSRFCLTDSGGIQEEASALKKPVLVTRDSTERQELVDAGGALLVGTDPHAIVEQACTLLRDQDAYIGMQRSECPFGDGHSAMRIVEVLTRQTEDIPSALLMPRWSIDNHALSTRH